MRTTKWGHKLAGGVCVLLLTAYAITYNSSNGMSYCTKCGRKCNVLVLRIAGIQPRDYFSNIEDTVLSSAVASTVGIPEHKHCWCYVSGGALFHRSCELGKGNSALNTLYSEDVARLIRFVHSGGDLDFTRSTIEMSLDPKKSQDVLYIARLFPLDANQDDIKEMLDCLHKLLTSNNSPGKS